MVSKNGKTTAAAAATISMEMPGLGFDVREVPVQMITANPWQPRQDEDAEHVAKLAESIREQGLLQIPTARPCPGHEELYELAFGHSRLAAAKQLGWTAFPLRVIALSDRQMADAAAAENVQRRDLSAIEIAQAIARYIKAFKVSQVEAARVYGYTAQSSVSNLMRLLELPAKVQAHVHAGALPERVARALIAVARFDDQAAATIADELVAGAGIEEDANGLRRYGDNMDSRAAEAIDQFYRRRGKELNAALFDETWPKKPLAVPDDIAARVKKAPADVPACKGCRFRVEGRYGKTWCLQPACLQAKQLMASAAEIERATQKLEIPIAAPDEKVKVVFDGGNGWDPDKKKLAQTLIEQGHPSLRLVPMPVKDWKDRDRKAVLGEEHVALATVDEAALAQAFEDFTPKAETRREAVDWAAEREAQLAARAEAQNRTYMVQRAAAAILAPKMPKDPAMLAFVFKGLDSNGHGLWFDDDYETRRATPAAFDAASLRGKQEMVAGMLLMAWADSPDRGDDEDDTFDTTAERLAAYARNIATSFGLQLPADAFDAALTGPIPEDKPWIAPDEDDEDEASEDDAAGDDEVFDDVIIVEDEEA